MKRFWVKYKVEGRVYVGVEAETPEEALELSKDKVFDCDLGELEDIDTEEIYVEDDAGKIVLEW